MTTLTEKEILVLKAFIQTGIDVNGALVADDMIQDNMTWMSASDLYEDLGLNKQEIGGIMSALDAKQLIQDGEISYRGARDNDWFATNAGITLGFTLGEYDY